MAIPLKRGSDAITSEAAASGVVIGREIVADGPGENAGELAAGLPDGEPVAASHALMVRTMAKRRAPWTRGLFMGRATIMASP